MKYEPVLVSKESISNIFGKKTENKVKTCKRDFQKLFIEHKTNKNQTVFIKCFKEKSLLKTAFAKSLKFLLYLYKVLNLLKEISQVFDKNPDEIYLMKDCLQNENILSCRDYKRHTLDKSVKIPATNLSENLLKSKKDQRLVEITIKQNTEV